MADRIFLLFCICFVILRTADASCPARCRSCQNRVTDCSKMNLVNPPKDFDYTTQIINMDGNALRVLGRKSFNKLPNVEVLKAGGNRIRVIKKDSFVSMPQLMTLDLSSNKISRIYSKSFAGVKNLKTLTMANNNIATVTGILDTVPTLFQLNLGRNKIRVLHAKTFYKNTHLHYLDLRYNSIVRIHADAFKQQKYLRYLFLNNNPLASLPALNMGSPVLQLIDLSNCKLRKIPQGFPSSVRDLRLGHNQIQEVRKGDIEKITNLRLLALNNNKINRVAFLAFNKLQNLQEIWLRDNKLIYIPRGLPDNLRKLYMDSNKVVNIEGVLFSNTSEIEYMTLENNQVMDIEPGSLAQLKFLKYLNLQGNKLMTLSKGVFANIRNVSTLTLSNNPISKIEREAFENLVNLTNLYISYVPASEDFVLQDNFLPAMPNLQKLGLMGSQSLATALLKIIHDSPVMHRLTELDLTFNDIQTLPSYLRRVLPNIQALSIDGNSLVCDNRLLWLARWMKTSEVKFFAYEEPRCEKPYYSKGKLLTEVPERDFVEIRDEQPPLPPIQEEAYVQNEPVQGSPRVQVARPGRPSPAQQIAAIREAPTRPPQPTTVAPRTDRRRGGRKRNRRLRNKQERSKTERRRRRKRRHRKTDEERRKRRRGNGRKRNRSRNRNRQQAAAAVISNP